ncbi:MAG: 50S ribosomal protein L9 [Buchananella hordeovulneris]|nr:50S ribosomal protein L9 [Buchananella hordeovulneris]
MAKLILTHEVPQLGKAGDVVEVKDGYARNYLVPRNLATPWTKGAQRQIDQMKAAARAREISSIDAAQNARDKVQSAPVTVTAKVGQAGRLFGAVSTADVAAAIKAAHDVAVDRRKIHIEHPIKAAGNYTVSVRLHDDVVANVKVAVVAA